MNGRVKRDINTKVSELLVEWLKTLVSEEEAAKITMDNYKALLPTQTHLYTNKRLSLSAFTERWIKQQIKKLMKKYPARKIDSFTLEEIKEVSK